MCRYSKFAKKYNFTPVYRGIMKYFNKSSRYIGFYSIISGSIYINIISQRSGTEIYIQQSFS